MRFIFELSTGKKIKNIKNKDVYITDDVDFVHSNTKYVQVNNNYFLGIVKNSVFSEMIAFIEPDFLAAPWFERFGLVTIRDYTGKCKSIMNMVCEIDDLYKDIYSYPYEIKTWATKKFNLNNLKYYDNYYLFDSNNDRRMLGLFIHVPDNFIVPDCVDFNEWGVNTCSCSNLTSKQLLETIKYISSLPNSDEIFNYVEESVEKGKKYVIDSYESSPSMEKPFILTIRGTDDSSWGIAVKTKDKCLEIIEKLKCNPTLDNMLSLGFKFTN